MTMRPLRSLLYMPATNARAIDKARSLACDAVILDLEDSVTPERKAEARAAAVAAVRAGGFGERLVAVRTNALDTPWAADDLAALASVVPDAVVVPKVGTPDAVDAADRVLIDAPARCRLWVMIETAQSVLNLPAIAARAGDTRLSGFIIGPNDLARELRLPTVPGRPAMLPILSQAALAARAHGLLLFDGVWNAIADMDGLAAECAQGAAWGMDGKTLIHPNQIGPCNAAFAPDAERVARAVAIIAAFDDPRNAGSGAIQLDGEMVERLHLEDARRVMAIAGERTVPAA